jgi:hypothetical protein
VIEARRLRKGPVTALICAIAVAVVCVTAEFAIRHDRIVAARQHQHTTADPYDMSSWMAHTNSMRAPPPKPRFRIEITPLPQPPPHRPPAVKPINWHPAGAAGAGALDSTL